MMHRLCYNWAVDTLVACIWMNTKLNSYKKIFLFADKAIKMDGRKAQNIEAESKSTTANIEGLSEVDLSTSEQPPQVDKLRQQLNAADDQLEFFGRGHGNESGEESPEILKEEKDSDSTHGAFVTISPPLSPGELCSYCALSLIGASTDSWQSV